MTYRRRIIANEAYFYAPGRLSPAIGATRLFPEPNRWRSVVAWMRWWHWAGLGLALLMVIDARL